MVTLLETKDCGRLKCVATTACVSPATAGASLDQRLTFFSSSAECRQTIWNP
jgi:hypothetical protein